MPHPLFHVDAFTDRPYAGNPAAVCLLQQAMDASWMQAVAAEMNLSETAFIQARSAEDAQYDLRWFTPAMEVDLCGHATLASAHILWEQGHVPLSAPIAFHTRSGVLIARRIGKLIVMDFPAEPAKETAPPAGLLAALGVTPRWVGRSRLDYLVVVGDEATVRSLSPDFRRLADIEARGVIVTAAARQPAYDFVSRFFAPAAGIDEDPVTGSAHCTLAPYWAPILGKPTPTGYQASARGGTVHMRLSKQRVILAGEAVMTLRGEILA